MWEMLWQAVARFRDDEHGATMAEYAIMLGLICGVCLAVVAAVGVGAQGLFTANGNALTNAL